MKKIILFFILLWSVNCMGQTWQSVDGGITLINPLGFHTDPGIHSMVNDTIHHYLYVGGDFDSAGHMPSQNLARWNSKNWSSIGDFNDTAILALCMYNDTLVVGDYLSNITFLDSAGNIINTFSADGFLNSIVTYKNELYVGGGFDEVNGVPAVGIARYNGVNWESVDSGMQNCCGNGENWALYVWNNKLYAGGSYYQAGDSLANNIASWNDTMWSPLGSGTSTGGTGKYNDGYIYSIGSYNNELYIGGQFDSAGGISSKWIARWNGAQWDSVGLGVNGPIYAFMSFNNNLYLSGTFDTVGSIIKTRVAKWNDTIFSSVDSGINGTCFTIDTFNRESYFGGWLDSAGNIYVNNIARLVIDSIATELNRLTINNEQLTISPNPFSQQATVQFFQPLNDNSQLTLYDLIGRQVENYTISGGAANLIIKRNNLPAGMYFYKVSGNGIPPLAGKVVIE